MGGAFSLSKTVFCAEGKSFDSAHATVVVAGRGVRLRPGPGRLRTRTIRAGPPPLSLPEPYLVFVHSTSWPSKIWPEHFWRSLTQTATAAGLAVVLPWGD